MTSGVSNTTSTTSAAARTTDRGTIAQNFDQFLMLLTTQLKNQSPLDPLDTNQFTQQLVQFASVEQQIKTNETLNSLLTSSRAASVSTAASFVGMTVTADGAATNLSGGSAKWTLNAARAVPQAVVEIRDATGNVVATRSVPLSAGAQTFSWDGLTSTGAKAPDGTYMIAVSGKDTSGTGVTIKTEVSGTVTSVDMSGADPVLLLGETRVPMANVKTLTRTAAK